MVSSPISVIQLSTVKAKSGRDRKGGRPATFLFIGDLLVFAARGALESLRPVCAKRYTQYIAEINSSCPDRRIQGGVEEIKEAYFESLDTETGWFHPVDRGRWQNGTEIEDIEESLTDIEVGHP
jgi:hypothetical protein